MLFARIFAKSFTHGNKDPESKNALLVIIFPFCGGFYLFHGDQISVPDPDAALYMHLPGIGDGYHIK